MTTGHHRLWFAAFLLLVGATACTEPNEYLADIGVTQLRMLDGDLTAQSITDPGGTIQAIDWTITAATLSIDGVKVDLLFGDPHCVFTDSVYVSPQADGECGSGTVLGSDDENPISAKIELTFTMVVRRAQPLDITSDPAGDFEGDGVPNAADICPFAYDPSQEDLDGDGLGDACSTIDAVTGVTLADADGDGWEDNFDNCIWYPNPDQADADYIPDGIGDRCPEQRAMVIDSTGSTSIEIGDLDDDDETNDIPIEFTLLKNRFNYLIVDFNTNASLSSCNWSEGTCTLDPAEIEICVNSAVIGCAPS